MSRKRDAARQKRKEEALRKAWAESPVNPWEIEVEDPDGWDAKRDSKQAIAKGWKNLGVFLYDLSPEEYAAFMRICIVLAAKPKRGYEWHCSQETIDSMFDHMNEYVVHPETRLQLKRMITETKRKRKEWRRTHVGCERI